MEGGKATIVPEWKCTRKAHCFARKVAVAKERRKVIRLNFEAHIHAPIHQEL